MAPSAGDENYSHHEPQQEKSEIGKPKQLGKDHAVSPFRSGAAWAHEPITTSRDCIPQSRARRPRYELAVGSAFLETPKGPVLASKVSQALLGWPVAVLILFRAEPFFLEPA